MQMNDVSLLILLCSGDVLPDKGGVCRPKVALRESVCSPDDGTLDDTCPWLWLAFPPCQVSAHSIFASTPFLWRAWSSLSAAMAAPPVCSYVLSISTFITYILFWTTSQILGLPVLLSVKSSPPVVMSYICCSSFYVRKIIKKCFGTQVCGPQTCVPLVIFNPNVAYWCW